MKKIRGFFDTNSNLTVILIGFLFLVSIISVFNEDVISNLGDEKINRGILSVGAFLTGFSFIFNAYENRRKRKEDLVSKSRIEWIQEVRRVFSEYLSMAHRYPFLFQKYNDEINEEKKEEYLSELNDVAMKIEEKQYLLYLYFSDNSGNKEIIDGINEVHEWIISFNRTSRLFINKSDAPVATLTVLARDYLKREWDRAKLGE